MTMTQFHILIPLFVLVPLPWRRAAADYRKSHRVMWGGSLAEEIEHEPVIRCYADHSWACYVNAERLLIPAGMRWKP